ncbi:MAG: purine-nucleoside phosphorylase [Candidatus Eisenbacteria bacterium]|nr:purine-nucleoside phosphorylase [Candidatus Eisenbacteria bacterium]
MTLDRDVSNAARHMVGLGFPRPEVCVVLGSGLSSFVDGIAAGVRVPYGDIPGFPMPAVSGHAGAAVGCKIGGAPALVLAGRVHHYEGFSAGQVTFGVRLSAELGARTLVVTNASGGLDPGFEVGDLMLIDDQITAVSGSRRLSGRTFRMAGAYTDRLKGLALEAAADVGIRLRRGVYMGSLGPTYETPAETGLARLLGASAVGMSTVTEVQAARALGLAVLGIAMITNIPLPGRFVKTTHSDVLEAGKAGASQLVSLVKGTLERL